MTAAIFREFWSYALADLSQTGRAIMTDCPVIPLEDAMTEALEAQQLLAAFAFLCPESF